GDAGSSTLRLFPTPGRVAAAPETVRETLDDEAARAVLAAAEAFEGEDLSALSSRSLVARLSEVRGFDPRSATFVARRGFGRASLLPVRERRLREAVADLYGLDDATDDDIVRLSNAYGDHRGYWAHYVRAWASLRDGGDGGGDAGDD
ncbi:DNA-3-methyladenine glycosylase 2 family protein, partial [Halopelagius fulvigenes]